MHEKNPYQQGAFDLNRAPSHDAAPTTEVVFTPDARDVRPLPQFHSHVRSDRPVPGEAWAEYILEAESRAESGPARRYRRWSSRR